MDWYWEKQGNGKQGLILWFHGFMGSGVDWKPIAKSLNTDHTHLLVDLPGHGKTRFSETQTRSDISQMAHSLHDRILEEGFSEVTIIGYSMGGRFGLVMTSLFPGFVNKLVLESASPGLATDEERKKRIQNDAALADRIAKQNWNSLLSDWYAQPVFSTLQHRPELREILFASRMKNDRQQLQLSLDVMGTGRQPSLWPKLANLNLPVLLITGQEDEKFTKINTQMNRELPTSSHKILPGCSHIVHLEKPLETVRLVRHFLSEKTEGD